jgi:hypothetical protein
VMMLRSASLMSKSRLCWNMLIRWYVICLCWALCKDMCSMWILACFTHDAWHFLILDLTCVVSILHLVLSCWCKCV